MLRMSLQQEVPSHMFTLPRVWEQVRGCNYSQWIMPTCECSSSQEAPSCLTRGLGLRCGVGCAACVVHAHGAAV